MLVAVAALSLIDLLFGDHRRLAIDRPAWRLRTGCLPCAVGSLAGKLKSTALSIFRSVFSLVMHHSINPKPGGRRCPNLATSVLKIIATVLFD
jgi:hypothetical protein